MPTPVYEKFVKVDISTYHGRKYNFTSFRVSVKKFAKSRHYNLRPYRQAKTTPIGARVTYLLIVWGSGDVRNHKTAALAEGKKAWP